MINQNFADDFTAYPLSFFDFVRKYRYKADSLAAIEHYESDCAEWLQISTDIIEKGLLND